MLLLPRNSEKTFLFELFGPIGYSAGRETVTYVITYRPTSTLGSGSWTPRRSGGCAPAGGTAGRPGGALLICMRNSLGWLETWLASNLLHRLKTACSGHPPLVCGGGVHVRPVGEQRRGRVRALAISGLTRERRRRSLSHTPQIMCRRCVHGGVDYIRAAVMRASKPTKHLYKTPRCANKL